MSAYEVPLHTLSGEPLDPTVLRGRATLIVNVASRCGLTPQYEALQDLYETYRARGLVVLGVPCDQFGGQEPGTPEEIAEFCSSTYAVTFPITEKLEVNGQRRHPLYEPLVELPDSSGAAGDVQWNFEKFLVSPQGRPVARFRPTVLPESAELIEAIEANLPEAVTWSTKPAREILPGDHVSVAGGAELIVTRIEERFLGRDELLCLIEDTPARWLAQPVGAESDVKILGPTRA